MHKQIQTLVQDAIDVVNRYPTSAIPDALGLIIQRAIVLGHQDCMRGLRERGVIHDPCKGTDPVAATRPVEEQRLETGRTATARYRSDMQTTVLQMVGATPADVQRAADAERARSVCGGSR